MLDPATLAANPFSGTRRLAKATGGGPDRLRCGCLDRCLCFFRRLVALPEPPSPPGPARQQVELVTQSRRYVDAEPHVHQQDRSSGVMAVLTACTFTWSVPFTLT
jgi:hypothetical protein